MKIEIDDTDIGNEDKIRYCLKVILKEAKKEDRLVKQIFYHMLSAYTSNPLNLAINAPSGEGKNYVLRKVAENFPKEDVMFLTGMTDKALFHRAGKLVIKNNSNGEYEDIENLIQKLDSRKEDIEAELASTRDATTKQGLKAQLKTIEEEKQDLSKDAKKLIDLNHKILIFLDTPRSELLYALMSLLSHDNYEGEYEYADSTNTGIKTRSNVLRGWPVMIFSQAIDFSGYKRSDEITRRFVITNPKMTKEKYEAAIDLIAKKFSYPSHVYDALVVTKREKHLAQEIIKELKQNILNVCEAVEPGNNNAIVPFWEPIKDKLNKDKAHDMTVAYRLFSYLSLLSIINIEQRPRIIYKRKSMKEGTSGETQDMPLGIYKQVMPIATYEDLKEATFLMEYADGVRPYILEWFNDAFLATFNAKKEPDSKLFKKDDLRIEDRIAVTSEELVKATKEKQDKTFTIKQILQTRLEPLMNEGFIDKQQSNINGRNNIYYPLVLEPNNSLFFLPEKGQKRNKEQENNGESLVDFTLKSPIKYIKAKVAQVLSCSTSIDLFCELSDSKNRIITNDELIERYFPKFNSEDIGKGIVQEEQETEAESSSVSQTEDIDIPSAEKMEKRNKERQQLYCCNYCSFGPVNQQHYEWHIVNKHQRMPGYPDKNGRSPPIQ